MKRVLQPTSTNELAEIVASQGPFFVEGTGTKAGFGRDLECDTKLSLCKFAGVTVYEPEELIIEAGAATPLRDIQNLLVERRQLLAFEPPDHGHLWGSADAGSIGGVLACGLSGPRRIKSGSARDHVLGVTGVTGRGEAFKAGARVVKNVTGYDMPKLMAGSCGTLAAMTSVIFKVLPAPETEETVRIDRLNDEAACQLMSLALQSQGEISAAAHVPGKGTFLRFEGISVSVTARRDRFVRQLKHDCEVLNDVASRQIWASIRDCRHLDHDESRVLWRLSLVPSEAWRCVAELQGIMDFTHMYDWGGGLLWLSVPAQQAHKLRQYAVPGHATLYAAPAALRRTVPVFQPQEKNLAALTRRIKSSLDPAGKLNAGRMYEGV